MRRRSVLGSLLALLAATPKAIFAAEDSGNSFGSDFLDHLEDELQQNEQNLLQLKSRQEQAQQEVVRTQRVQAAAIANLQDVENELFAKVAEVNATQFQIDRLQIEIHSLTQDIALQEAILADEQEIASGRLRALYKLSRVSPLEVILTASSFSEAINRITIFQRILGDDVRHIRATQERKAELDSKHAILVQKHAEVDQLKLQREYQQAQLESLKAERESLLANAEQRASSATQQNASLREEIARREAENLAIQADIEAAKERLRSGHFELPQEAPNGWRRPAAGYISAAYGVRTWLQSFHTGIDYAVGRLSPVHASQAGRVIKVGYAIPGNPWSSYGMMVIVQHSWHEASLYAHLDDSRELPVKEGDPVQRGQPIGFVGMTGFTSGPHLHFEIRLDNIPKNPNNWLR
ncbi:MAG: peptidoglycan DD-metalloendopeptidase family protein [Chloroflexi bacterium]|nr:peptidoglycan DD-metalloendopeptidase family protein [Chloroflexota bacterium]